MNLTKNMFSRAAAMLLLSVSILIGRQAESIAAEAGQSDRTVSGIVVDSNREPVAGASVVVKGTLNGTATDANGHFELTVNDRLEARNALVEFVELHERRFDPRLPGLEEVQLEAFPLLGPPDDGDP